MGWSGIVTRSLRNRAGWGAGALALLVFSTGCSFAGASWHNVRRVPGYVVPPKISLVVDTSERANEADHGGYLDTMVLTVREELGERGVESSIVSPKPARLPTPRIEIIVRTFDEGNAADSYVTGLIAGVPLAGAMDLAVMCRAYSASNQLMFEGLVDGETPGTANARDMAELIGSYIAKALTEPESTRPKRRAGY